VPGIEPGPPGFEHSKSRKATTHQTVNIIITQLKLNTKIKVKGNAPHK
jgi:hypothetical protein